MGSVTGLGYNRCLGMGPVGEGKLLTGDFGVVCWGEGGSILKVEGSLF